MLGELPGHVSAPDPSIYWSNNYVVLDFETTTELKGSPLFDGNRIVLACWNVHKGRGTLSEPRLAGAELNESVSKGCFANEFGLGELVRDIEQADFIVAHNVKFELGWLKRCGLDLRNVVVFDTMIAEYVLAGNTKGMHELSLGKCLARRGLAGKQDTVSKMIKNGVGMGQIPDSWLLTYCQRDVEACDELFQMMRQELKDAELEAVNYQRCLVSPCLADIEFNGVQLDCDQVLQREEELEYAYIAKTNELQTFCEGASPASPKQMREFIYSTLGFSVPKDFRGNELRTPSGDPSTAVDVLARLVPKTDRQRRFLDLYKAWTRIHGDLTKYLRKFGDCVRMDGGHLRGNFNQCNTRTHRLSSTGVKHKVQFQNFNRDFKPMFTARHDGWLVGEADGAQLEFRVATHLGRDSVALGDIVRGEDIHQYTASIIGCSRQDAKAHTFKPLYGGTSGTPEQRRYYDAFKAKYYGIADTQQGWTQQVLREKFLKTECGLKYYWPNTRMAASGWITNSTSIYNYPIQGFATAEIIPLALVAAWHRMRGLRSFLVNTVHDSIIAEVHPTEVDLWSEVAKQCLIVDSYELIEKLYGIKLTVPLGAGVKVATHWGHGEEVKYEAPEELWLESAQQEGMI